MYSHFKSDFLNKHQFEMNVLRDVWKYRVSLFSETQILNAYNYLKKMEEVLPEDIQIQAAIFNLGYLPKSDKKIITLPETTLKAFEFILNHLAVGGRLVCVLYYGHEGGEEEKNAVLSYAAKLPQQQYQVLTYQFINQIHCPPICLCIEKIKEEH